jgi:DNA (cytosine-5)-methyltransferase 1
VTLASRGHSAGGGLVKYQWRTDPALFASLDAEFGFDFDAAANDGWLLGGLRPFISPEEDALVTPWATKGSRAWFNPPWGGKVARCAPSCRRDHVHRDFSFRGTGAFISRAIEQVSHLSLVVMLVPTAPDTTWYRRAAAHAHEVRQMPRIRFWHPETMRPGASPPGAGITAFVLKPLIPEQHTILLCDALGKPVAR